MSNNKPISGPVENLLADTIIDAIQDVKGSKIADINLDKLESAPAFRFIVCQGKSTTQVQSIADNIRDKVLEQCHTKPYNTDGERNAQWIVMDYGAVIAHIFLPEVRELYNLEDLWNDADINMIPDLD